MLRLGVCLLVGLAWPEFVQAQEAKKPLRWGGDASGGAPFIIERKGQQPGGFEGELAEYLAAKMDRRAAFVQKQWDQLPNDLDRGDIDIILNGYEWSPGREQFMDATIPYYVYKLQLLARDPAKFPNAPDIVRSWDDLRTRKKNGAKRSVGVLKDSAAHRYLEQHYGSDINIVATDAEGSTGMMLQVRQGVQDATLQDLPVALYYVGGGREFPDLAFVGEPVAPGYYVIFVHRRDAALREQLNDAIRAALKDGTLQRIYENYGLWSTDQEELAKIKDWPPSEGEEDRSLTEFAVKLGWGALMTVVLACVSMPLAILVGLLVAIGRQYGPFWLSVLLGTYVELIRGTPLFLQLLVIYYVLPNVGLSLYPIWAGVMGLVINYSAYEAEIYRAGLLAIPRGQMEAALSLGMTRATAIYRVIVPQAVRLVVPPVANDFIALFKDTSIVGAIGALELTGSYRTLATNNPGYVMQLGLLTGALYLLMSYPLSLLTRRLEKRTQKVMV